MCCIVLAIFAAITNLCSPAFAVSDSCNGNHSYATYTNPVHNIEFQTDYCTKCGYIRIHKCQYSLRFMTVGKTYSYTDPRTSSASKLLTDSARINVNVVGRVRNENAEL